MFRTRDMSASMVTREDGACVMSFSSESEVEVWPGEFEVLSHAPGACDMTRLQSSGCLLFNHNRALVLARIDSISIDSDKMGRCVIPKDARALDDFAVQQWKNIDAGVLRNTSVGYRVIAYTQTKREDGSMLYTVTKWQPSEVSIVTVPADTSTGVDRSENKQNQNAELETMNPRYQKRYQSNRFLDANDGGGRGEGGAAPKTKPEAPAPTVIEIETERRSAIESERTRISTIMEACRTYNAPEIQERAIKENLDLNAVRGLLLEHVNKANDGIRQASSPLGLSQREVQGFSFVNLLNAMCEPANRALQERAKHEITCCQAAADKRPAQRGGMVIPIDVLMAPARPDIAQAMQMRALAAFTRAAGPNISATAMDGYTGTGGAAIAEQLLASAFIEILRHRCILMGLGTELTGLVGNFDIPKMTSSQFGGGWIGEDAPAPQTQVDFGLVPIRPKTAAAYAYITRKMLTQPAIGIEALVRMDLAKKMGQTIDLAGYYGTGEASDPVGLKNQTGIHAVPFAAQYPTYNELVEMETRIGLDDADVDTAVYLGNARLRGYAKTALKFPMTQNAQGQLTQVASAGTIWEAGATAKDGMLNGYSAKITNQIAAGDVFFGNFADLIIGLWGGLEIIADPFTYSKQGGVSISTFQDVDFAVRRLQSFCYGSSTVEGAGN